MRKILAALVLLAAPLAAVAQAPKYAVLSLIGDRLYVVQREFTTGTNMDRNERYIVEMPDNTFDRTMSFAIEDALRKAVPGVQPVLLASRRGDLYDAVFNAPDHASGVAKVYGVVKPMVEKTGATHLVLVTKHRNRAMLRLRDGYVGAGYLEGLGFYVDQGTLARNVNPNDAEAGFLAPYAYFNVTLIDVASGRVLARHAVVGSDARPIDGSDPRDRNEGNAWNRMTEEQKVEQLTRVIREEAARAVPMVMAKR